MSRMTISTTENAAATCASGKAWCSATNSTTRIGMSHPASTAARAAAVQVTRKTARIGSERRTTMEGRLFPNPAKRDWVTCPVCGEPDMRREEDAEGAALILCVNHACASNGGTNSDALTKTTHTVADALAGALQRAADALNAIRQIHPETVREAYDSEDVTDAALRQYRGEAKAWPQNR
jgi:hypothetical protein